MSIATCLELPSILSSFTRFSFLKFLMRSLSSIYYPRLSLTSFIAYFILLIFFIHQQVLVMYTLSKVNKMLNKIKEKITNKTIMKNNKRFI